MVARPRNGLGGQAGRLRGAPLGNGALGW